MTKILITIGALVGGIALKGPDNQTRLKDFTLGDGEELTPEAVKSLGLSSDDVARLVAEGKVVEIAVRTSGKEESDASAAELTALDKRASDAEAEVARLKGEVTSLNGQLAAAHKAAAKA